MRLYCWWFPSSSCFLYPIMDASLKIRLWRKDGFLSCRDESNSSSWVVRSVKMILTSNTISILLSYCGSESYVYGTDTISYHWSGASEHFDLISICIRDGAKLLLYPNEPRGQEVKAIIMRAVSLGQDLWLCVNVSLELAQLDAYSRVHDCNSMGAHISC